MSNIMPRHDRISDNLSRVAPSATMAMTQAARDMKASGVDVIGLAAGEPDFDTPDHIKEAACRAIRNGKTNYTNVDGITELKEQICLKFQRDNQLSYSVAQINVSPGGKPVLYNALMATLSRGDEVIIPAPCWVSYPEMVRLVGGTPIVLPCNSGVSKAYAMTGWRIGYGAGPEWLIKAMAKVMSQSTSNPCSISQWAATAALSGPHDFLKDWKKAYAARRNYVVKALNALSGLDCKTPNGAFYVYPDCSGWIGKQTGEGTWLKSDADVTKALLTEAHVALVPGTAFHSVSNLRLSYAADLDTLKRACDRIAEFSDALR